MSIASNTNLCELVSICFHYGVWYVRSSNPKSSYIQFVDLVNLNRTIFNSTKTCCLAYLKKAVKDVKYRYFLTVFNWQNIKLFYIFRMHIKRNTKFAKRHLLIKKLCIFYVQYISFLYIVTNIFLCIAYFKFSYYKLFNYNNVTITEL